MSPELREWKIAAGEALRTFQKNVLGEARGIEEEIRRLQEQKESKEQRARKLGGLVKRLEEASVDDLLVPEDASFQDIIEVAENYALEVGELEEERVESILLEILAWARGARRLGFDLGQKIRIVKPVETPRPLPTLEAATPRVGVTAISEATSPRVIVTPETGPKTRTREERAKNSQQIFESTLPDGQVVEIKGEIGDIIVKRLLQSSRDNTVRSDEIAKILYGSYKKNYTSGISRALRKIDKVLGAHGWRIVQTTTRPEMAKGQRGAYYIEKIMDLKQVMLDPELREWVDTMYRDLGGKEHLTRAERRAFTPLFTNPNKLVTFADLIASGAAKTSAGIKEVIKRLRKKIGNPELIVSVRGEGYKFVPPSPKNPT